VVKELHKQFVLVLNKVDLVPPDVVIAWKHYFQSKYPEVNVVCFTSYPNPDTSLDSQEKVHLKFQKKRKLLAAVGPHQLFEAISSLYSGTEVDFSGWRERLKHNNGSVGTMDIASCKPDVKSSRSGKTDRGVLTIGMIGYPNAGKSSIINGILNEKVVSVSRTPGHTKHFQTIHLSDTLVLCDCPGLVFPTVVDRQLEILSGIYPISQVREPYTVVGYLAQRVPLIHLLRLNNPNQSVEEGCPEKWTAWDVCDG
jgi:ribosome biogenesis GTPase A